MKGFNDQAVDGVPLPNTPYMGALWDPAAKAYTALWTGSEDPQKIMTDCAKSGRGVAREDEVICGIEAQRSNVRAL